ncbi:MAG: hypothetical protein WDN31_01805 [Hyphomicrobium sp.]
MREEYRRIAERRVRLGLVIGEIADKNELKITQDEMRKALIEQARRFPGLGEGGLRVLREEPPMRSPSCGPPSFRGQGRRFVLERAKPVGQEPSPRTSCSRSPRKPGRRKSAAGYPYRSASGIEIDKFAIVGGKAASGIY